MGRAQTITCTALSSAKNACNVAFQSRLRHVFGPDPPPPPLTPIIGDPNGETEAPLVVSTFGFTSSVSFTVSTKCIYSLGRVMHHGIVRLSDKEFVKCGVE